MKINWDEAFGYGLIFFAACFFGGAASLGKALMQNGLTTIMLMQIRSVITAISILILLLITAHRHLAIERRDLPWFLLLAIPGLALVNASYYFAVKTLTIALAVFIQFTAPVLVFLYGYFAGSERATGKKVAALFLSLIGTYLMVQMHGGSMTKVTTPGLFSAIASAASFAFYLILSHRLGKKYSPWTLILYGYGFAAIFWCIVQSPVETFMQVTQNHIWTSAILFTVVSTLIPFILFMTGLRRVTPTGAAIGSTTETVTASLFAYLFLGETISSGQAVGAILILAALVLLVYQN